MTAKEQLLERAPHWTEEQAERALHAAERDIDEWGDLSASSRALFLQTARRLDAEEQAAGLGPWPDAPSSSS